jgi:hypothetical protein
MSAWDGGNGCGDGGSLYGLKEEENGEEDDEGVVHGDGGAEDGE